jgi:uncharacterized protein YoxC
MEFVVFLWGVIAATLLVVAVFHIRTMIEIRRTVTTARECLIRLDAELTPTIREAREVVEGLKVTVGGVASRVEDLKSAMESVGDTGRSISRINCAVGEVADFISRVSLFSTGIKAAASYVVSRISRRRG